jgi:uncharacterized phage protein (TIGR02216 family)
VSEAAAFPWREAMAAAFGVLRWTPDTFWRATLREFAAALEGLEGGAGPAPALARDLDRLMAAFPDEGRRA